MNVTLVCNRLNNVFQRIKTKNIAHKKYEDVVCFDSLKAIIVQTPANPSIIIKNVVIK